MTQPKTHPRDERGASLILALVLTFLVLLLGTSLLSTTGVEYGASKSNQDSAVALADVDSAVAEVIWRLNLTQGASAPPAGSTISVNSLSGYDASLRIDPLDRLTNLVDDDGDGTKDEMDELAYNRDWDVRITLTGTNPADLVTDADPDAGPPYGSTLVEPTIQPAGTWKDYSITDPTDLEVLTVRFKMDTDTTLGDVEGDGDEIVFWDAALALDGVENLNTLSALGGNANPNDDSPYNITYTTGGITYKATGAPVLIVDATARVKRAGKVVAKRKIQAEVAYPMLSTMGFAVCGCQSALSVGNTDSYSSSAGGYGGGNVHSNGDVGSNGNLGVGTILGSAIAGGWITGADGIAKDATAGGTITGTPGRIKWSNYSPPPQPCGCDSMDVDALVTYYSDPANNDNASAPPCGQGTSITDTCALPCGTYYYDSIDLNGNKQITIAPPTCVVTIYLSGPIYMHGTEDINKNGRPYNMRIISNYTGDAINLGGNATFTGTLYAPKGHCHENGTPDVYGSLLCATTSLGGAVHYDEDLGGLWKFPGRWKVISWREVE